MITDSYGNRKSLLSKCKMLTQTDQGLGGWGVQSDKIVTAKCLTVCDVQSSVFPLKSICLVDVTVD